MAACFQFDIDKYDVIRMIIAGIGLVITIIVGTIGTKQLKNMKKKLYPPLKYLFYLSLIGSSIRCLCSMFAFTACICNGTHLIAYYVLLLSLLGTQITRLQHTFAKSVYALSKVKLWSFGILFVVTMIAFGASVAFNLMAHIHGDAITEHSASNLDYHYIWVMYTAVISIVLYLITGTWAVIEFSKRLLELTKSQTNTVKNLENIELNESQQKLINQISRYNALFSLAVFTSALVVVAVSVTIKDSTYWLINVTNYCTTIDCIVNIVCIYLQYSFATKYYIKYCKLLDLCWKLIINKAIIKSIKHDHRYPLPQVKDLDVAVSKKKISKIKSDESSEEHSEDVEDDQHHDHAETASIVYTEQQ